MTNTNWYPGEAPAAGKPVIKVIGVGGAGSNVVGHMASSGLRGVTIIAANTDTQALAVARADQAIHLGSEGRFENNSPETGRLAAEESLAAIKDALHGAHLVFVAAGMGGAAGTGASPVIAGAARETGALTVGLVTTPLRFEGKKRTGTAEDGIQNLRRHVDFLVLIPLENLYQTTPRQAVLSAVFSRAEALMHVAVRTVRDALTRRDFRVLGFDDVVRLLKGAELAAMGSGSASGKNRARDAARHALARPLLENSSIAKATGALITITAGLDLASEEVHDISTAFMNEINEDATILINAARDDTLADEVRISFIATTG